MRIGNVELLTGFFHNRSGDGKAAKEHSENCIHHFEQTHFDFVLNLGLAWGFYGMAHCLLKGFNACRRYIEKGIELQNAIEAKILLSHVHFGQGMNRFEAEDPTTALTYLEKARKLAQRNHERWVEASARIGFGEVLAKIDPTQRETAKQEILEGIQIAEELRLTPLASWGNVALAEG